MGIEFRRLSVSDGDDLYEMLQEIPGDENGFINPINGKTHEEFRKWLVRSEALSNETGLQEGWRVPTTIFWLFMDDIPVGYGKLRHFLTDKLMREGGQAGYAIRPDQRGKGYGKALLRLLLQEAGNMGIERLLLTIRNGNAPSIRVALANGGIIEKTDGERHFIWLDCRPLRTPSRQAIE